MITEGTPINPTTVVAHKKSLLPTPVLAAWNDVIAQHFDGKNAVVKQVDICTLIRARMNLLNNVDIYANNWLDIEPIFEAEGWYVEYDKPAYWAGESGEATFIFTVKKFKK